MIQKRDIIRRRDEFRSYSSSSTFDPTKRATTACFGMHPYRNSIWYALQQASEEEAATGQSDPGKAHNARENDSVTVALACYAVYLFALSFLLFSLVVSLLPFLFIVCLGHRPFFASELACCLRFASLRQAPLVQPFVCASSKVSCSLALRRPAF